MSIRLSAQDRGFTLAGLLVLLAIMSIFLALAVPLWSRVKQRDNEEELIFRGNEFIKAIARYHQKFGIYPPDIETLVKLKYLRHDYLDPMTKSGKWKVLHPESLIQTGAAGIVNPPGRNTGQNPTSGQNPGTSGSQDRNRGGLSSEDDNDNDNQAHQDSGAGFGSDDDKNKDEEPEVESVGPVVGVTSRSKKASIRIYNGQTYYNKWTFMYALQQQQQRPVPPRPGGGGVPGQPGQGVIPQGGNQPGGGQQGGAKPPSPPPQPQNSGDDDGGGGNL